MKKFMTMLGIAVSLTALSWPSLAAAQSGNPFCEYFGYMCSDEPPEQPAHEAPEIDAAGAGLALALLGGIVSIARERRRGRQ